MFRNKLFILTIILMMAGLIGTLSEASDNETIVIEEITGTVVDAITGENLTGVELSLAKENTEGGFLGETTETQEEEPVTATTDEEGAFTFENIEDGTYTLSISHEGYEDWSRTYTVSGESIMTPDQEPVDELEISLQPSTE